MSNESLNETKNKILLLEEEIKELNKKRQELNKLKKDYYYDYFKTKRDDYSLLTDIPNNPTQEKHVLYDYSVLNVDTIGKIICDIFKNYGIQKNNTYELKNYISQRLIRTEISDDIFHSRFHYPVLVIGEPNRIFEMEECKKNIIIEFDTLPLKDYPTNNPIEWDTRSFCGPIKYSNYNHLVGYHNDLSFDNKGYEIIRELILSLSYYQKEHSLKMMNPQETWDVYRKTFKKHYN